MHLKAAIFDMDGVLVDTVKYHYWSWKKAVAPLGILFSSKNNDRLRGLSRMDSLDVILEGRNIPESEKQELLERKNNYFIEYIGNMGPGDLLPGVSDLLNELKDAGILTGVSSSSRNVRPILAKLRIDGLIKAVGDGNSVEKLKPSPDIFLFTASALGVNPEECVVIEDGTAGIAAGMAAGMCVVGVGPEASACTAHCVFPDLANVRLADLREIYMNWHNVVAGAVDILLNHRCRE